MNNPITTRVATGMATPSNTVTVNAIDSYWGEASGEEFALEVYLPAIYDATGKQIMETGIDPDTEDEYTFPYTAVSYYSTPDTSTAVEFLGYTPAQGETSAWNVYADGWGAVNFNFSNEVFIAEAKAELTYLLNIEDEESVLVKPVPAADIVADWDFWTGNYVVTVYASQDATITQENLMEMTASITGIKTLSGEPINIKSITYTDASGAKKAPAVAGITIQTVTEEAIPVYSINGALISKGMSRSEINNLKPGLYVVNGHKVLVK